MIISAYSGTFVLFLQFMFVGKQNINVISTKKVVGALLFKIICNEIHPNASSKDI